MGVHTSDLRGRKRESGRHNADHGVLLVIQQNVAANQLRVSSESTLP